MSDYVIQIKEKEKKIRKLDFKKLESELYNIMYKKTILENTRTDLSFYLLLYFFSLKGKNNNSLAHAIFEEYLPLVTKINSAFRNVKGNLNTGEYAKIKEENGLTELFKNDVFFYLVKIFSNTTEIELKYSDFFSRNPYYLEEIKKINSEFGFQIGEIFYDFNGYKISDVREDDLGNEIDLSKSIYNPIQMRMAKRIDLTLTYRTDIKTITSQSPIDITFLQSIDPQIIFDLWDRFNLAYYVKQLGIYASNNPLAAGFLGNVLGQVAYKKIEKRGLSKRKIADKEKNKELEKQINELKQKFTESEESHLLINKLEERVKNSDIILERRISNLEEAIEKLRSGPKVDENKIDELSQELEQLKNLEISVQHQVENILDV